MKVIKKDRFKITDDLVVRDEDKVCFDRSTGWVVELNDIGYLLIKLLNGKYSLGELCHFFSNQFQIPEKQALSDVKHFLSDLDKHHIIEKSS